ncbi:MAG: hypothetical protein WBQ95_12445 [Terracidiphilus sp.]
MPTRNVTLAISQEAHLTARLWAARHDVSLSAIVSALLEGLPNNPNAVRVAERIHQQWADSHTPPPPPCETVEPMNSRP